MLSTGVLWTATSATPHYPPLQPPAYPAPGYCLPQVPAQPYIPVLVPGSTSYSLPSSVWCYHTLVSYISTRGLLTRWWPVSPIQTLADDVGSLPWIIPFVRHLCETSKLSVCTSFRMYVFTDNTLLSINYKTTGYNETLKYVHTYHCFFKSLIFFNFLIFMLLKNLRPNC